VSSFKSSLKKLNEHALFWVVISLALVISPHLERFPAWSILTIGILLLWRLYCIKNTRWLPPKWLLIIFSLAAFMGIYSDYGTLFGKTAGTLSLSILLAIKLHESHNRRDYMLLILLSFFIIVTNFLFSQSILMVVFMVLSAIVLIFSLLSINQGSASLNFKYKLKISTTLFFQALPLMLIAFILFPRISGPFIELPDEKQSSRSGLGDKMTPGNISNLIQSNALAFRVEFENTIPKQHDLYWRALVLWHFDGNTWEQGKKNISPFVNLRTTSTELIHYTVTLEPHQKDWLYALDIPAIVPSNIDYNSNYTLKSHHNINRLFKYTLASSLQNYTHKEISPWEKSAGLKIPKHTNPKTIKKGRELSQQYTNTDDIINHVLQIFNQQDFYYTLRPPLLPGYDTVDQFLFETRRGFCEHYASSFTLLMRAAGIPARIVMGFQGGTINPLNNIMTVRNTDAHAWSEVWIKHRGWVRIDPTAVIAPQRIEKNLNAALDSSEILPFYMQFDSPLIKNALFYWDVVDSQWDQWVIGYNEKSQQRFLDQFFNKQINMSEIFFLMMVCFMLMLLILSIIIMKPWNKPTLDPAVTIYNSFCRKLASKGVLREYHEGPRDYAQRAISSLPENKQAILLITKLYISIRYGATHHKESQIKRLKQLNQQFKPKKM